MTSDDSKPDTENDTDSDTKKVNFLVSMELFERFKKESKKEYKSITGILTDWMATYVKEKEKEQESSRMRTLLSTFSRTSDILFKLAKNKSLDDGSKHVLERISGLILQVTKDPAVCESIEFSAALSEIERIIP